MEIDVDTLCPGARIGRRWLIQGTLGEGGSAVVYDALDLQERMPVALKVLRTRPELDPPAYRRFVREAHICAAAESPWVPRIHALRALPDGTPFVVMEKIAGRSLAQHLEHGPLPIARVQQVAEQLLAALEHIHDRGILHRDIKPHNLLLENRSGGHLRLRMIDFGVSRSERYRSGRHQAVTQRGALVGTPSYMAPEQLRGVNVDVRADLYGAAAVLYEALVGHVPHERESLGDLVAAVLRDDIPPVRQLRPDCPPALARALERALAREPADRFHDAAEMAAALRSTAPVIWHAPARPVARTTRHAPALQETLPEPESLAARHQVPDGHMPLTQAPARPRRRPWRWLAAAACLGLGALWGLQQPRAGQADGPAIETTYSEVVTQATPHTH